MSSREAKFPARFAELVYLLANRPDAVLDQENALIDAAAANAVGEAVLTTSQLNVDLLDEGQSDDGVRLHELVMRMSAHSAHEIKFLANTPSREIFGVARILAGEAQPNDDGAAFDEMLIKLGVTSVEVHLGRNGVVRSGGMTPTASPRVTPGSSNIQTPLRGVPAYSSTPRSSATVPTPSSARAVRATPARGGVPVGVGGGLTLGSSLTNDPPQRPPTGRIRDESPKIIEGAIKSKSLAHMSDDELIEQLRAGVTPQNVTRMLDELVAVAEARARESRWEVVARIFETFVFNETAAGHHADIRRSYTIGIRRLTKPTLLRGIAGLLPRRREMRDALHTVLVRLGAEGAEALIDLLTSSDVLTDRRAYLAALVKCRDAVPTLMHLLGDNRWYVARNASDLLGEMRAIEAENALMEVSHHREERVRRSVATALARIGTPRAIQAVQSMLGDPVPEVRIHAAQGLGNTQWPKAVAVLSRALDEEQDAEVQAVILAALGHQGTEEAVTRLVKAAEPDGRLFKRKPTVLRVSAVQALAEANTPSAIAALKRFLQDKERDVRDIAARALRPKEKAE
jgi:hypothetical protein